MTGGAIARTFGGFMLGGVGGMLAIVGLEEMGIDPGWAFPLLFFGGAALEASGGPIAGAAIGDRLGRRGSEGHEPG